MDIQKEINFLSQFPAFQEIDTQSWLYFNLSYLNSVIELRKEEDYCAYHVTYVHPDHVEKEYLILLFPKTRAYSRVELSRMKKDKSGFQINYDVLIDNLRYEFMVELFYNEPLLQAYFGNREFTQFDKARAEAFEFAYQFVLKIFGNKKNTPKAPTLVDYIKSKPNFTSKHLPLDLPSGKALCVDRVREIKWSLKMVQTELRIYEKNPESQNAIGFSNGVGYFKDNKSLTFTCKEFNGHVSRLSILYKTNQDFREYIKQFFA